MVVYLGSFFNLPISSFGGWGLLYSRSGPSSTDPLNTCSCMKHGMSSSLLVHIMLMTSHILQKMAYFNFSLSSLGNQILSLPLRKHYHGRSKSSWQTGVTPLGMHFSVDSISLATFLLYTHGALCLKHI